MSNRFASNDGVSLETEKWAHVLQEYLGHTCFFFAGISDWPEECSYTVDIAHFKHPKIQKLHQETFSKRERPVEVTKQITTIKDMLKQELNAFVKIFDIQLLIIENAMAIPMNIPSVWRLPSSSLKPVSPPSLTTTTFSGNAHASW